MYKSTVKKHKNRVQFFRIEPVLLYLYMFNICLGPSQTLCLSALSTLIPYKKNALYHTKKRTHSIQKKRIEHTNYKIVCNKLEKEFDDDIIYINNT